MIQSSDSLPPSLQRTPANYLQDEGVVRVRQWKDWQILAFGQGVSLLLATMWASQSSLYLNCDWNSPAFSSSWAYLLLSFHLIPLIVKGRSIRQNTNAAAAIAPHTWFLHFIPLQAPPWIYLGATFLSFYGIYLSLLSIRYTTITSTSLFDSVSIPTTMILSRFFLGRRYLRHHILGAMFCLAGVILNVGFDFSADHHIYQPKDAESASSVQMKTIIANVTGGGGTIAGDFEDGSDEYPHKAIGDVMACMGGILLGAHDVVAEFSVRRIGGTTEYLGMIGFFGIFLSLIQMAISERDTVAAFFQGNTAGGCASNVTAWLLVAYVIGQFSRKAGLALFLTMADAALLQLSLLTSDLYTLIFSVIYLHILPRSFQWIAMILVVSGIIIYEVGPKSTLEQPLQTELEVVLPHNAVADQRDSKMV